MFAWFVACAAWFLAAGSPVSYRSIVDAADAKTFYAGGGQTRLHERLHLHVPATTLLAKADGVIDTKWGRMLVLKNKSVPLLVSPADIYYRKIRQRVESGDTVCVKGVVKPDPRGDVGRCVIYVHQLKKADDGDVHPAKGAKSAKPKAKASAAGP